ncbi:helix-turn-helix domain-containing protein [Parafrankia sp. FMc2]|uniref:helix-turn-helix domain-containing protein n=1 Tax=Parafrankia sp. FMc2 TaxID=3233196 RepID=UPI0034D77BAB
MKSSIARRSAVSALYSHVRTIRLVPTVVGGRMVSVRVLRSTLLGIAYYLDATDWSGAFPSMATLAARAEVSVSTARRAVRALEMAGILATERGGGRRSNRYRIVRPSVPETGSTTAPKPVPEPSVEDRAAWPPGPITPRELMDTALPGQKDKVVILHEGTLDDLRDLAQHGRSETARCLADLPTRPQPVSLDLSSAHGVAMR